MIYYDLFWNGASDGAYKTAFITEAVTGKIDVRDFEIPETLEEESYEALEEELSPYVCTLVLTKVA